MTARMVDCGEVARVRLGEPVPAEWIGFDWYVATVRAGRDGEAREMLESMCLPVFMMEERRSVRSRVAGRTMADRPLWPGYLFVADAEHPDALVAQAIALAADDIRVALERRAMAADNVSAWRMARGFDNPVTGFLGTQGRPVRVDGAVMQALFAAHEQGRFVPRDSREALRRRFAVGQKVVIDDGPFRFVEGVVESFCSGEDVEILANVFGGQVPVKIGLDSLKAIDA